MSGREDGRTYQAWAYDARGSLVHAGPLFIKAREFTGTAVRRAERTWRAWRRQYLRDNPDAKTSPLGRLRRLAVRYNVEYLGWFDCAAARKVQR